MQRLREAAASRSFHLKNNAVLRDLAFEPYTFVASVSESNATASQPGSFGGGGGGGEEGWDDWGDDEIGLEVRSTRGVGAAGEVVSKDDIRAVHKDVLLGPFAQCVVLYAL